MFQFQHTNFHVLLAHSLGRDGISKSKAKQLGKLLRYDSFSSAFVSSMHSYTVFNDRTTYASLSLSRRCWEEKGGWHLSAVD